MKKELDIMKALHSVNNLRKKKKPVRGYRSGFTLIELVVVIAIMGILAILTAVIYSSIITSSRESVAMGEMENMAQSMDSVITLDSSIGNQNSATAVVAELNTGLESETQINSTPTVGNVFTSVKKDPWGKPYTVYVNCNATAGVSATDQNMIIVIKSSGKNTKTNASATTDTIDGDDLTYVVQVLNGGVHMASNGFKKDVGTVTKASNDESTWYITTD